MFHRASVRFTDRWRLQPSYKLQLPGDVVRYNTGINFISAANPNAHVHKKGGESHTSVMKGIERNVGLHFSSRPLTGIAPRASTTLNIRSHSCLLHGLFVHHFCLKRLLNHAQIRLTRLHGATAFTFQHSRIRRLSKWPCFSRSRRSRISL